MKNKNVVRSPLFYVGDKYKLMRQLKEVFPQNINSFYDVFCGGGSVSLNITANNYYLNDIDNNVIDLHNLLIENSLNIENFIMAAKLTSEKYGLSVSEDNKYDEIEKLKKIYKKTYFSQYNKESYLQLRADYNENQNDKLKLYLLLVYGFNHMIRFNKSGKFNLPVGNVDWNKNVTTSLRNYGSWAKENYKNITLSKYDFEKFVTSKTNEKDDFFYFDPPYLITFSEYNKLWSEEDEIRLYKLLDYLDTKGIKWGLSNMLTHKSRENIILKKWSNKYRVYNINSNYISKFDNSIKNNSKEIYVTNYIN